MKRHETLVAHDLVGILAGVYHSYYGLFGLRRQAHMYCAGLHAQDRHGPRTAALRVGYHLGLVYDRHLVLLHEIQHFYGGALQTGVPYVDLLFTGLEAAQAAGLV